MVDTRTAVLAGVGVASLVGGFALDRMLADTPSRVASRVPEFAKPPKDEYDEYDDDTPSPAGTVPNALALWLPFAGTVVGGVAAGAAAGLLPADRIWSRHPFGLGALTLAVAGASMFTGAGVSRLVLG